MSADPMEVNQTATAAEIDFEIEVVAEMGAGSLGCRCLVETNYCSEEVFDTLFFPDLAGSGDQPSAGRASS